MESLKEMYAEVQLEKPEEAKALETLNAKDDAVEEIYNEPSRQIYLERGEEKKQLF